MTAVKSVRVGVVGTGMMGNFHLRTYAAMKDVELAGVFDIDASRAEKMAAQYNCRAFTDLEAMAAEIDAASVVTPSVTHAEVGSRLLAKGIPCLIEKPLATNAEDCQKLIDAAKQNNVILAVGHIERFNPAVEKLSQILKNSQPAIQAIEARRMSLASARITDVDVVEDLMIHDIEVVMALMNSPVVDVHAEGFADGHDHACALLKFANNAFANITASRITKDKIRTLDVMTDAGHFALDYINQTLDLRLPGMPVLDVNVSTVQNNISIFAEPPLLLELKHFIDCVQNHKEPRVPGEQALSALQVVWRVQQALKK